MSAPENWASSVGAKFSLEIFYVTVHYRKRNEICHFDATSPCYPNRKSGHSISERYGHNRLVRNVGWVRLSQVWLGEIGPDQVRLG